MDDSASTHWHPDPSPTRDSGDKRTYALWVLGESHFLETFLLCSRAALSANVSQNVSTRCTPHPHKVKAIPIRSFPPCFLQTRRCLKKFLHAHARPVCGAVIPPQRCTKNREVGVNLARVGWWHHRCRKYTERLYTRKCNGAVFRLFHSGTRFKKLRFHAPKTANSSVCNANTIQLFNVYS